MWGPKCEKVRKPWVLRLKRWSLSMRVSDEEQRERDKLGKIRGGGTCDCVVTHASSFCSLFVQKLGASRVAVCTFDDVVL